jgi:hypothetical protein
MTTNASSRSKRVLVSLPEHVHRLVAERAEKEGKQPGQVMREAIAKHVGASASRRTIGGAAEEAILAGATNQEALEAVLAEFPGASTGLDSIRWYRTQLRKKHGPDRVPTDSEASASRK